MKRRAVTIVACNRAMRATAIVALIAFGGLALSACDATTQAALGEALEMGPYTFSVISATQGKQWESAEGTYREIVVRMRVHRDDTAPFTHTFASSFIDSMAIVDAAGNSIRTGPSPVSPIYTGGRYRSEYTRACSDSANRQRACGISPGSAPDRRTSG